HRVRRRCGRAERRAEELWRRTAESWQGNPETVVGRAARTDDVDRLRLPPIRYEPLQSVEVSVEDHTPLPTDNAGVAMPGAVRAAAAVAGHVLRPPRSGHVDDHRRQASGHVFL